MKSSGNRFLEVYSGMLTAVFCAVVLTGAASSGKTSFEEIDVHRLNLREPDGTLRYVLSSAARFPGVIIRGEEYEHPRPQAGMLFYNDEGTEVGGLIFAGGTDGDGNVMSGGSLTFDRYEQDQIVQIMGLDLRGRQIAGMQISDRPGRSIVEDLEERKVLEAMDADERSTLMQQRRTESYYGADRLFVGRSDSGNSTLMLNDANGKPRMVLMVAPDGGASIRFLDEEGEVVGELTPESLAG